MSSKLFGLINKPVIKFLLKIIPYITNKINKKKKTKKNKNDNKINFNVINEDWLKNNDGKRAYIIIHHSSTKDMKGQDWNNIDRYHRSFRINFSIIVAPYDGIVNNGDGYKYVKMFGNIYEREAVEKFYNKLKRISGGTNYDNKYVQKRIGKYYVQTPWKKIGYNLGIEQVDGELKLFYGRNLKEKGAHCYQENMNNNSIGILFVGNFDNVAPSLYDYIFLVNVIKDIKKIFPNIKIFGHREVKGVKKTCPGKYFNMDRVRRMLK